VAQNVAHRDAGGTRVVRQVVGRMVGQPGVERQHARIDQPQHRIGEHRLGERGRLEDRVGIDRSAGGDIANARRRYIGDLAIAEDRDGEPGDLTVREQLPQVRAERRHRRPHDDAGTDEVGQCEKRAMHVGSQDIWIPRHAHIMRCHAGASSSMPRQPTSILQTGHRWPNLTPHDLRKIP
jgi:hypothetical protein